MRKLERGASYVPLIIVIVLLVVAVVWAYVKQDEADQQLKEIAGLKRDFQLEQEARIKVLTYLKSLSPEIGWPIDTPTEEKQAAYGSDYERVNNFIQNRLKGPTSLTEKFVITLDLNAYNVDPENGGIQVDPQDPQKIGYISPDQIPSEANLEYLFGLMLGGMERMLHDIGRLTVKIQAEKNGRLADGTSHDEAIEAKNGEISTLRDELAQEKNRAASNERALRDEINGLQGRVRQAEDTLESEQRARRDAVAKLNNELLGAKQEVKILKKRQEPDILRPGPDGEILASSESSGMVVLNRGKTNRMMPGLTFLVYNYGKGGVKVDKGRVQVLDVSDATATARILDVFNPMNPIVGGDMFESVVYNPDTVLHFYLLGNFRKYGHSDAGRRLQSLGAMVDGKVTIDTDFLVMGAPASEDDNLRDSDAYKQAAELGIPVITEAQLGMFLKY